MSESSQLMRQWQLLQMLSSRKYGVTLQEMVEETEVSSRTLLRDLRLLKSVGFPLTEQTRDHGKKFWSLANDFGIAQLHFTLEEAAALYLGRQFLEVFAGTFFWKGSQQAYRKIRAALSEHVIDYLDKLASSVHLTHLQMADYSSRAQLIDDLMVAIEDSRITVLTYQSMRSTEPVTYYDIHPYALVFHMGALYLIAWSMDHQSIRTFKIDRISEVEVQSALMKFQVPDEFDAAQFLENSFGIFGDQHKPQTVRVLFSAQVVRILEEKQFHSSQKLTRQKDGSVIAEYLLSSFEEFRSFILSFGQHATVLEPVELIESIQEEIAAMRAHYEKQSTTTKQP